MPPSRPLEAAALALALPSPQALDKARQSVGGGELGGCAAAVQLCDVLQRISPRFTSIILDAG